MSSAFSSCLGVKKLKLEDVLCFICRGIFIEPISLPCRHVVCLQCLERTIESNSLTCPICRFRIGSYIRHAKGLDKLINETLWYQIQKQFPHEIMMKRNGEDDGIEEKILSSQPRTGLVTGKGYIKDDFDHMINKLKIEEQKTRLSQHEASEKLAKKLMEEELAAQRDRKLKSREIEKNDVVFVKRLILAEKANDSSTSSLDGDSEMDVDSGRDSISIECRHFTPICVMPKTPPKLLPNGEARDTKILKPVNLSASLNHKRNYLPIQHVLNQTTPLTVSSNNFLRTKPIFSNNNIVNTRGRTENLDDIPEDIIKDQEAIQRRILQEKQDLEIAMKLNDKWNKKLKSPKKRNHGYSLRSVHNKKHSI